MTRFLLFPTRGVELDIEAVRQWYERERPGLGAEFLDELEIVYERIVENPWRYEDLRSGTRRASVDRFPYSVYFNVDREIILVLAVLHSSRNPEHWQQRTRGYVHEPEVLKYA